MIYKKILNHFILFSAFSVSSAHAWTCPGESKGYVGSIHYDNSSYSSTFTLSGHSSNWMQLSPNYGLNTDYGKALFTLLITAKSAGIQVEIKCNNGVVNELYLLDTDN
ncbi:hypothetical protein ID858_01100 [Xenorhabdus sp. DI]|uniref:hypothetical protein n=1 Tax=Xenorhabdus doucetiae TaxID=351671 RepID=UPI0019BC8F3A|nr:MULTISPECIES: hypothetical protein [unclassified Xenorhabdus]MBD2785000.1 hypothetical protein [Xenorhabdus sp. 3]MBD2787111.1 hypothetical protein [Xenorhabdus sp. DI]MBD2795411.1 hypothetical protein [Xenorhabdus sp. 18]